MTIQLVERNMSFTYISPQEQIERLCSFCKNVKNADDIHLLKQMVLETDRDYAYHILHYLCGNDYDLAEVVLLMISEKLVTLDTV